MPYAVCAVSVFHSGLPFHITADMHFTSDNRNSEHFFARANSPNPAHLYLYMKCAFIKCKVQIHVSIQFGPINSERSVPTSVGLGIPISLLCRTILPVATFACIDIVCCAAIGVYCPCNQFGT